ncbi:MAG: DUF5103 domain-containing protein [Prevotellaceae bacterium]|nr:DUF5103 domain-containing protein [Prevotellaceae bacterium]
MRRFIFCFLFPLWAATVCAGGQNRTLVPYVRSLRVECGDGGLAFPALRLGSGEHVRISFDADSHDYRRFVYKAEHCGMDWEPNEDVFDAEYLRAAADYAVVEDYAESINTTWLYTHYSFEFPNADMQPLLSGNYKLTVFEDSDDDLRPVAEVCLYVYEPLVGIGLTASADTDVDRYVSSQQLSLNLNYSALSLLNPREELRVAVLQNRRTDNARMAPPPTADTGSALLWEHARNLIFEAGNEYRKFEILSTRYPGMHVDGIRWYDPVYHAALQTDSRRRNYLYDEDNDGIFVPRAEKSGDADVEADYLFVHFTLDAAGLSADSLFVAGAWTGYDFSAPYRMSYDTETDTYGATLLLKQGYYEYLYLTGADSPVESRTAAIEGDYYQTENEYTVLVYWRTPGSRYDRLAGWRTAKYINK